LVKYLTFNKITSKIFFFVSFKYLKALKNRYFTVNSRIAANPNFISLFYSDQKTRIYRSEISDRTIRLFARRVGKRSHCPNCRKSSHSVRSFYLRTLADLPVAANAVLLFLETRRFACKNPHREKRIYSERFNDLTGSHCRRTTRASSYLKNFLVEVSSNKGSYFSKLMNIPVSSNTCLRLVKSLEISVDDNPICLGIDDWAKRKGMDYGTIIVNADTGRPIDLIDNRNSTDVAQWLSRYQNIKYVTRDRASSYTSAIKKAIPEAKQIADRFHLVKNLSDAIQEEIRHEYSHLKQISRNLFEGTESMTAVQDPSTAILELENITTEKKKKFLKMNRMKAEGHSNSDIARKTQTNRRTVNSYLAHGIPAIGRTSRLDYKRYIGEIRHMCSLEINPTAMFRSLKNIGMKCCQRSFTRWFDLNFANYVHKGNRTYPEPLKVIAPAVWKISFHH
jgi:DNA-binding NarL/FixJ family response regulator